MTAFTKHIPVMMRWGLGGFALASAAFAGVQLSAQSIIEHNSNAPVDVAADRIEVQDKQNRAIFSGNVDVRQEGLTLRSQRTLINYSNAGSLQIERITASGGVNVSKGNESASGNVAVYDFNRRVITLSGDVRLRRGSDWLTGGRLTIDLDNNVSSIDGSAGAPTSVTGNTNLPGGSPGGGRVRGRFTVPTRN